MPKIPKGHRQLTRMQRVKVATFLIQAAIDASPDTGGVSQHGLNQLGFGLSALAHDGNVNLNQDETMKVQDLASTLGDAASMNQVDAAALATAWELEVWPPAAPSNKKPALATATA